MRLRMIANPQLAAAEAAKRAEAAAAAAATAQAPTAKAQRAGSADSDLFDDVGHDYEVDTAAIRARRAGERPAPKVRPHSLHHLPLSLLPRIPGTAAWPSNEHTCVVRFSHVCRTTAMGSCRASTLRTTARRTRCRRLRSTARRRATRTCALAAGPAPGAASRPCLTAGSYPSALSGSPLCCAIHSKGRNGAVGRTAAAVMVHLVLKPAAPRGQPPAPWPCCRSPAQYAIAQ